MRNRLRAALFLGLVQSLSYDHLLALTPWPKAAEPTTVILGSEVGLLGQVHAWLYSLYSGCGGLVPLAWMKSPPLIPTQNVCIEKVKITIPTLKVHNLLPTDPAPHWQHLSELFDWHHPTILTSELKSGFSHWVHSSLRHCTTAWGQESW